MNTNKPYYILETAYHHEGDDYFLKNLIKDMSQLDAQAIKFHLLFDLDDYMVDSHAARDVIKDISIQEESWNKIFSLVESQNKSIIALCNDVESLKWVNQIQDKFPIAAIELHSTGLNDVFLLQESLNFKQKVILGIGGSTLDEIQFAVDFLRSNGKENILLMHGFQNYPTDFNDINLDRMNLLKSAFDLEVGYADHTDPKNEMNIFISVLPIINGFNIIEKHVTNSNDDKRIDAQAAISIKDMSKLIDLGNTIYKTKGEVKFKLSDAEKKYGDTGPMKKAIVARRDISKGEELNMKNLAFKRTENSSPLMQKDLYKLIGKISNQNLKKDEIVDLKHITYNFEKGNFDQFFVNKTK